MILTQNSLLWLRLKNKNFSSHGASFSSIFLAFWSLEPHGPTWGVSLAGFCPGFRLVLQSPLLLLSAAEPLLCSERGGPRSKYTRRTPLFSPEENVSGQSEQPVSIFIEPRCNSLEAPWNRFPPPPPWAVAPLHLGFARGRRVFTDRTPWLTCFVSLCFDPLLERTGNKG